MRAQTLVLVLLAFAALAGCSKAPPSGTLAAGGSGVTIDGTTDNHYQKFDSGGNPLGAVPAVGGQLQCVQDMLPMPVPPVLSYCTPASTKFRAHFMALPMPDASGYHLFLAGGTGASKEQDLGAVIADAANMWEINKTIDQDLTAQYKTVELRMGDFVLATASANEGKGPFALADGLAAISATGGYHGKVLNVTISGLPANGTFVGRLYSKDPTTGLLAVQESFPVKNGANEFTAKINVQQYAEFHIHASTSLINLYKTQIGTA